MTLTEELKTLVELVKRNAKRKGEKITQEMIAQKFGVSRTYLSDMLSGRESVSNKTIVLFKEALKDYLIIITPEMALLSVLMEEMAEYKSQKERISKKKIIEDWKNKANSKLAD
jgi:transcriptional regulator with XRE-family HTH domain